MRYLAVVSSVVSSSHFNLTYGVFSLRQGANPVTNARKAPEPDVP